MSSQPNPFEEQARQAPPGLIKEFCQFLGENKKWWLLPILIILLLMGILVLLSGTGAAPFIYTLH